MIILRGYENNDRYVILFKYEIEHLILGMKKQYIVDFTTGY